MCMTGESSAGTSRRANQPPGPAGPPQGRPPAPPAPPPPPPPSAPPPQPHAPGERAAAEVALVAGRVRGARVGRSLAGSGARLLEGVVALERGGRQRGAPAGAVDEPQVLVGRDVPQVPGERAHERVLLA